MPPRKRKVDFPCLKCGDHCKKGTNAIQCFLCELWIHQTCSNVDDTLYKYLLHEMDLTGKVSWHCDSCHAVAKKLNSQINDLTKRITTLELGQGKVRSEVDVLTTKADNIVKTTEKSKMNEGRLQESTTAAALSEQQERKNRELNVVVYRFAEPAQNITDGIERKEADKAKVNSLFADIGAKVRDGDIRFVTRIGEKKDEARPMLVGLTNAGAKSEVIGNAKKLAVMGEEKSNISIAHDLTKLQRHNEQKLFSDAVKKNQEMALTESVNWEYKVIGRRGERRLVKVRKKKDPVTVMSMVTDVTGSNTALITTPTIMHIKTPLSTTHTVTSVTTPIVTTSVMIPAMSPNMTSATIQSMTPATLAATLDASEEDVQPVVLNKAPMTRTRRVQHDSVKKEEVVNSRRQQTSSRK